MTYEEILSRALSRVPNDLDKREGSPIFLALAPLCFELSECYMAINAMRDVTFADTSIGDDLTRRCEERGITRKSATYAKRRGEFNCSVPIGSRFRVDEVSFTVTSALEEWAYILECEQLGTVGNDYIGAILPVDYVKNLTYAQLTDILIPGEEVEDDESLRKRYFDALQAEGFGGNIADYKNKVKAIEGVGGVKVYPVWNGGGTVKLVIQDSTFSPPSNTLIDHVQTLIDPEVNKGEGVGIAPIGHVVTVFGVKPFTIQVTASFTYEDGYTFETVRASLAEAVKGYFEEIAKTWEDNDTLVVRQSYIGMRLLAVKGIVDVTDIRLNGADGNLVLDDESLPVLGDILGGD